MDHEHGDDEFFLERNGIIVEGDPDGYDVFAPGDGSLVACFPDAELAIRFVEAFEQEPDLVAADAFDDDQFDRVQIIAGTVFAEALDEIETARQRLREWVGLEDSDDAGPDTGPAGR